MCTTRGNRCPCPRFPYSITAQRRQRVFRVFSVFPFIRLLVHSVIFDDDADAADVVVVGLVVFPYSRAFFSLSLSFFIFVSSSVLLERHFVDAHEFLRVYRVIAREQQQQQQTENEANKKTAQQLWPYIHADSIICHTAYGSSTYSFHSTPSTNSPSSLVLCRIFISHVQTTTIQRKPENEFVVVFALSFLLLCSSAVFSAFTFIFLPVCVACLLPCIPLVRYKTQR